jgi:DNA-binding MarR family transcriptional regulator
MTDTSAKPPRPATGPEMGMLTSLLGYQLRRAHVAVFQHYGETMGAADITPGQFGMLTVIGTNPGLSQTQLGTALGIDRSTVVAMIDRLESRRLVLRAPSPTDRRSHALQLSGDGKALLLRLEEMVRVHESHIARDLSPEERTILLALLDRIAHTS